MTNFTVLALYRHIFPDKTGPLPPVLDALREIEMEFDQMQIARERFETVERQVKDAHATLDAHMRIEDEMKRAYDLLRACVTTQGIVEDIGRVGLLVVITHIETLHWVLFPNDESTKALVFPKTLAALEEWLRKKCICLEPRVN